jgi:hypothetical protein
MKDVMASTGRIVRNGVVAGLLGAAAVALWFLVFDISRGRPFETPALLAAVLLHGASDAAVPAITAALVFQYTVFHVLAFVLFGTVAAALIVAAETEPGLVIALVIFFAGFEVFFIALVMFHGPTLMAMLSWWSILVGNLLATGVMFAYFFFRHRALGRALLGPWVSIVREGVEGGTIGAATVALWFVVYDTAAHQPLRTPALLGAALLKGLRDPAALQISAGVILGYSVLHGAAFILFGVLAAVLLAIAEREPIVLLGVFVLYTCFEVFFFSAVMLLDEALLESLGWWTIFVANILATAAMLGYFLPHHRGLRGRLLERWAEQE